ncbi:uncharacterized protein LOC135974786 isoform X3 [Chrysemys picta bellii]|uniref:uncharacterized protein LOC135974786 isoform X3 n=1 Tax=Chrysemys picta bellii TaxID=8478 RepID=UPI0032B21A5D
MSEEVGAPRSPVSAAGGHVPFLHEELCDRDSVPAKCKWPAAPSPPVPDNPQLQSRASLDSIIGEGCRIQVDNSINIIEKWKFKLEDVGIRVVIGGHDSPQPQGVGFAKNQAVIQSSGTYLCFLDSDDVMMPQRVRLQHEAAIQHPNSSTKWISFCPIEEGGRPVAQAIASCDLTIQVNQRSSFLVREIGGF